jgi:hypothetical protein
MARADEQLDPYTILAALERNYVDYVVIGGLGRVLRGTFEITHGVDICPSLAEDNVERLRRAARELRGRQPDLSAQALVAQETVSLASDAGELKLVAAPAGVPNGFADLRRAATREHLGQGLRPLVASTADLARMSAALHREQDVARLPELRRIVELEVEPELMPAPPEVRGPSWDRQRAAQHERGRDRGMER